MTINDAKSHCERGGKAGEVISRLSPDDLAAFKAWFLNHVTLPLVRTPPGQWNSDVLLPEDVARWPEVTAWLAGATTQPGKPPDQEGMVVVEPVPANYRGVGGRPRTPPQPTATQAKQMGYLGDPCHKCGSMRMVAAGACAKCEDCGEQGGCS